MYDDKDTRVVTKIQEEEEKKKKKKKNKAGYTGQDGAPGVINS